MSNPTVYFTAADVAEFCKVNIKTVHNWSDRGSLPHFRTPGRHLRFKPADLRAFLEKFGYDVPTKVKEATEEKAA